ncbi:ATP-grasp domain-containing protein [Kribbella sp. NPDC055071]
MSTQRALQIGWRRRGTSALRRLGYDVDVLVDAESWDWYARPGWADVATEAIFVENHDWSEHLSFALNRLTSAGRRYDAVVGFDEHALIPACLAASMLGLPGMDWRVVCNMRDKSAQKATLREGGVACASAWLIDDVQRKRAEITALGSHLPLVLKPYSGAGTVHTYVARTPAELEDRLDTLIATPVRTVLVETYVDGVEHHADGVMHDGEIVAFSLSEYLGNLVGIADGVVPASVARSATENPSVYRGAKALVSKALKLLGVTNGVFHVELFQTSEGWFFSEAGMRVGGGGISLHHQTVGAIDLHEAMARAQVGLAPQPGTGVTEARSVNGQVTGWSFLPGPPGTVRDYPDREEVLKRQGVLAVEFDIQIGQQLGSAAADTIVRVGTVVLGAPTRNEFVQRQRDLVDWFRSRVEVSTAG